MTQVLRGISLHPFLIQIEDNYENRCKPMTTNQVKEYTQLLQRAEDTTSRKEAIELIRAAERLRNNAQETM